MKAFGDQIKEAREARGQSLEELAEATRIAQHHLAALERSDVQALPAGPFAKGYIEACAKVLGVAAEPILASYREEAQQHGRGTAEAETRMLDELHQIVGQRSGGVDPGDRGGPGGKLLAAGAAVVVVLMVGGWLLTRDPSTGGARTPGAPEPPPETPRATAPATPEPPPEPAPSPTPTPELRPTPAPQARANPDITIPDFGVGTGVENRRLVGAGSEFPERSEVVFWNRVRGGGPGDGIVHVWLHEGRGIARIPLTIGGSHWRTYSTRPLPRGAAGRWTVEARGLDGALLARQEFVCISDR